MADNPTVTNKSLGQHWLTDPAILSDIAEAAGLSKDDTVLEIGPGLGTLTNVLSERAGNVVAVEFDRQLALDLDMKRIQRVRVVSDDFLRFDLSQLPANYKVVANIPYYITAKIVQKLVTAKNRPSIIVLLVQKEVAERLAADAGDMSVLAVSAQLHAEISLGNIVPAAFFTPPPKVDSQVVVLKTRKQSLISDIDERQFFRVVKAGFSQRRKKLRTAMAGGLNISKFETDDLLKKADIDPGLRAQDLSLDDWQRLAQLHSRL